jgi:hypothetical protein
VQKPANWSKIAPWEKFPGSRNDLNIPYTLDSDENGDTRINQIEEVSLGITANFSL